MDWTIWLVALLPCCSLPGYVGPEDCPICGTRGKPVSRMTLVHLLRPETLKRLVDTPYFFCETPECDVVYYTESGEWPFYKDDLRVRVGVKEDSDPIPVCYCFNFTEREIIEDVEAHGRSTIAEEITVKVKAGTCSCVTSNPSGRCCLGNVQKAIKKARTVARQGR